jgi:sugar phosphate isomerase/epimerase
MDLGPDDLVFCSGTRLNGSFREVVDSASAGDFKAISIWPSQLEIDRRAGLSIQDMRDYLAEREITVLEIEPLLSWVPNESLPEFAREMAGDPPEVFLDWAEALGAPTVLATDGFGAQCGEEMLAEAFASVCDQAAARGLRVKLEFLPWSSVPDVASANRFLDRVDRPNAGIMFDTIHFHRGSGDLGQLEATPGDRILGVQLCDAPESPTLEDLGEDSMHYRLLPGEGVIPLVEIVQTLDRIGYRGPMGAEIFSDVLNELPADEVGRRAAESTRALLRKARSG